MAEDGRLHFRDRQAQLAISCPIRRLRQHSASSGQHIPIAFQPLRIVDVTHRDAAAQMAIDVLQVFRLRRVDITRQVEVEIVPGVGYLLQRNDAGKTRVAFVLAGKDVHDAVNVALAFGL